uniref:Protein Nef n=1 Tax=Human immunodeficiency virus type 1 TaxID=11676 RepID=Q9PWX9_HV1|nr:nef [Human immunodeficiency virus 1]BAA86715.1 nef [Human immunodeficiency virus 1]BAA86903.1 NEF [Human immunodeficiency virus 1]
MGGKWSKCTGWPAVRERMERAEPAAEGVGAASRDLEKHGALTSSNTATNNAACAWLEAQEEEEVGFPVRPQVPLRPMTYKGALDLSHFLKEKGGLEGLVWSQKKDKISLICGSTTHKATSLIGRTTHQGQGPDFH